MKNNKWIFIPIATLILGAIVTFMFLPKSKLSGGYSDELYSSKFNVKIESSELFENDGKIMLELITTVWNKTNNTINLETSNFLLDLNNPIENIQTSISKDESIKIRQVFEYQNDIKEYAVYLQGDVFKFNFTFKNNELRAKNIALQQHTKENNKHLLLKKQEETLMKFNDLEKQRQEEKKSLEKEAEQLAEKKQQEKQEKNIFIDIKGVYFSKSVGSQSSSFVLTEDQKIRVIIDCDQKHSDILLSSVQQSKINDKYTFSALFNSAEFGEGPIVFTLQDKYIAVLDAPAKCIVQESYEKQ